MPIVCTVYGWEKKNSDDKSCQWDDGAVSSTVSKLLNLLFFLFALLAVSTASHERNLRFLNEERDLGEPNTDTEDPSAGSVGTTTPEATTSSEEPTTSQTEATTSSEEPKSSESEATTSTEESATTSPSSSGSGGDVPTVEPSIFRCYLEAPALYTEANGFKVEKILCNLPDPVSTESTGSAEPSETVSSTAEPAQERRRVEATDEVEVTIEGISDMKCTASKKEENGATELTCGDAGFNITDNKFTALYGEHKSVVYVGCKLGNSLLIPADEKPVNGTQCPSPLLGEDAYNTTCEFDKSKIGTGDEYRLTNDQMTCFCPSTYTFNKHEFKLSATELDGDKNKVGTDKTVELACKKGQLTIQCKSTGWEVVEGGEDGQCLNDGAVSTTISSILLSVIMILAIVL